MEFLGCYSLGFTKDISHYKLDSSYYSPKSRLFYPDSYLITIQHMYVSTRISFFLLCGSLGTPHQGLGNMLEVVIEDHMKNSERVYILELITNS